ncbi:hypothetical protein ATO4_26609 [Aurantimonas sp. 22II-16-19i]|nr:hypothetical protein ATO4_26609 [Aurantimonas sp. 22II-16-19i]
MPAELAAGYCGEKHVEDFLQRVGKDYPHPRVEQSRRRRFWYRSDLDRALGLAEEAATSMGARFREKIRQDRGG